jgi:predicted  nucleic acid-binding Zn-ribbon protein
MEADQEITQLKREVERLKHQRSGLRQTIDTLQDTAVLKDKQIEDMKEFIQDFMKGM